MTLKSRIIDRGINAMMILILWLGLGIYSCVAQRNSDPHYPQSPVKNAGKVINISPDVNVKAKAVPMRASINSPYPELKPIFSPKGDRLYFSRVSHPNNTEGEGDMEDIWYSSYDSTSNTWSEPIRMSGFLNNAGPNFIESASKTGDTLILGNQYTKKGKMKPGVSYTVNVNGEWSFPKPIQIMDDYNMSNHGNHYVSLNLGVIISAVERADSKGHRDLYISFWNGEYATEPVNMGGVINTDMEESSPYLACDSKTLYFASKGHNGYGGYDIFKTTRLDDSWTNWSVPVNLGPAVNGNMDEEFFSITHCGRFAIFTKQYNVHNEDLFKIPMDELFGKPRKAPGRGVVSEEEESAVVMKALDAEKKSKKQLHTLASL